MKKPENMSVQRMLIQGVNNDVTPSVREKTANSKDELPSIRNETVNKGGKNPPKRIANIALRPREYLTEKEIEELMCIARNAGRNRTRDTTMILMAYRHGLRCSELCGLRWHQIDFDAALLDVVRGKNGYSSPHSLRDDELRLLRQIKRDRIASMYVFCSELGAPLSAAGFRKMLARVGLKANFPFGVHPHMLRHACRFKLTSDGRDMRTVQDYLSHTEGHTQLPPDRFLGLWEE